MQYFCEDYFTALISSTCFSKENRPILEREIYALFLKKAGTNGLRYLRIFSRQYNLVKYMSNSEANMYINNCCRAYTVLALHLIDKLCRFMCFNLSSKNVPPNLGIVSVNLLKNYRPAKLENLVSYILQSNTVGTTSVIAGPACSSA